MQVSHNPIKVSIHSVENVNVMILDYEYCEKVECDE